MSKVYFSPIKNGTSIEEISDKGKEIFEMLVENERIKLEPTIPLKVHFGEKGNETFIAPKNYEGIIQYLQSHHIHSMFIETNVLYRGERTKRENHIQLAHEHGFTQLPIIIADGDHGEEYELVAVNQKNFKTCMLGKEYSKYKQLIVLSHFKGHIAAGFGGAIKQLAMGCASRGGKLAQHSNSIPKVNAIKCKACKVCARHCPEDAIRFGKKAKIDKELCIGCASCIAVCPYNAISHSWMGSISKSFHEKLAEYALAVHQGRQNIYMNFVMNITRGCDCEGHKMKPFVDDLGIAVSLDPVALDTASIELLNKRDGRKVIKKGLHTLEYAEYIGLGSRSYELIEI